MYLLEDGNLVDIRSSEAKAGKLISHGLGLTFDIPGLDFGQRTMIISDRYPSTMEEDMVQDIFANEFPGYEYKLERAFLWGRFQNDSKMQDFYIIAEVQLQ